MKRGIYFTEVLLMALIGLSFLSGCSKNGLDAAEKKALKKDSLTCYTYSRSGDMRGSSYSESVKMMEDGQVLLTYENADWHGADPEVTEYLVSPEALSEIEAVFRKYGMQNWHNKKFTDLFIDDGATKSYYFTFGASSCRVHFSSQLFPENYSKKLAELNAVLEKYRDQGERLPGLVIENTEDDGEGFPAYSPEEGVVTLQVYCYSRKALDIRIKNGLEDTINLTEDYRLILEDTGEVIFETAKEDSETLEIDGGDYADGQRIKLSDWLKEGTYRLETPDYSCSFEIR